LGAKQGKLKDIAPSRIGRSQMSTWQTPEAVKQLRIMAAEEETTSQALIAEALNLLFSKRGKPPIAEP
jgi:hypothetical protein